MCSALLTQPPSKRISAQTYPQHSAATARCKRASSRPLLVGYPVEVSQWSIVSPIGVQHAASGIGSSDEMAPQRGCSSQRLEDGDARPQRGDETAHKLGLPDACLAFATILNAHCISAHAASPSPAVRTLAAGHVPRLCGRYPVRQNEGPTGFEDAAASFFRGIRFVGV